TGRREEAVPLFAALWRCALRDAPGDFAASILGKPRRQSWKPLPNAVVLETGGGEERAYTLTPCRRYFLRGGFWEEERYEPLYIDRARLRALLREGDRRFRLHLKTGHPTKERPEERWAAPFAEAAIRAVEAARRPALTLALGELDRIRRDAAVTRESLLTEEERGEPEPPPAPAPSPDSPFAPEERAVLRALLRGEDPKPFLTAAKLLPSLLADAVNEALYDAVGDTVLLCEGDTLLLVEDYRAELAELLGEA
ncbi:MAG: tellurite resistance TerB C-terminal domain-containing protein, partial [bacterium]